MAGERSSSRTKETINSLKGDYGNIAFLLLLYVLQGIPLGLSSAVPLLLQNRKVSYSDQALFSFVTWPFSLKLLWAPIVDSIFWSRIGRRKSWLIPIQLGIGVFLLILSRSVSSMLTDDPTTGQQPNIQLLTLIFLLLNFLAATQDIAVDGWALTMLSRRNVGYASTSNTVGQTAGFFIGNVIFLALESADFCNKYLRSASNQKLTGVVTFDEFLHICGVVFLVITVLVAIFKSEKSSSGMRLEKSDIDPEVSVRLTRKKNRTSQTPTTKHEPLNSNDSDEISVNDTTVEKELSLKETFSFLYKIIKLPNLKLFAVVLLTCKIGFAAPDAVSGLKLVEAGVHKENLALLAVPMVPLQIVLPWVISRLTCGPRPLDVLIKSYPYRLIFGLVFPLIVYWTPSVKQADGSFPVYYYLILVLVYALHQITVYSIFVSLMAFHASISDPSIGGTYMTLLNTITNLGANWPSTFSLWMVDKLTSKDCVQICAPSTNTTGHTCREECTTSIDGYYIECAFCVIVGFIWLQWGGEKFRRLQASPPAAWKVASESKNN